MNCNHSLESMIHVMYQALLNDILSDVNQWDKTSANMNTLEGLIKVGAMGTVANLDKVFPLLKRFADVNQDTTIRQKYAKNICLTC